MIRPKRTPTVHHEDASGRTLCGRDAPSTLYMGPVNCPECRAILAAYQDALRAAGLLPTEHAMLMLLPTEHAMLL